MDNFFNFCGLNEIENWLVIRLYIAATLPIISIYYIIKKKVDYHRCIDLNYYFFYSFNWLGVMAFTYGLGGGLPVDQRRSAALTCAIPVNLNWFLNSLADVLVVWIGLYLVKLFYRNKKSPFF